MLFLPTNKMALQRSNWTAEEAPLEKEGNDEDTSTKTSLAHGRMTWV
jgi:hypothetical protein